MNNTMGKGTITAGLPQPVALSGPKPVFNDLAFSELEQKVRLALESYSNVHRGSGHFSEITTGLFENARSVVLKHMGLDVNKYILIFCSVYGADLLKSRLSESDFRVASSAHIGLPLGIRAIAIRKSALPHGVPFQTGGSVARMVSANYVIWAGAPQRYEAGTPLIINAIAFAVALNITDKYGLHCFRTTGDDAYSSEDIFRSTGKSDEAGLKLLSALKMQLIGKNMQVPTVHGNVPYINLDNAASTPTFEPVWEAVKKTWRSPASSHKYIISEAKKIITGFLGANRNYKVLFSSNTTEAINAVARFIGDEFSGKKFFILNTMLEHNANELPWRYISGASLIRLPVDNEGFFDLTKLEIILHAHNSGGEGDENRIRLVAVNGASNVTGTFNNIEAVSRIAHEYGARVLVDGAQMVAHRKVELVKCGIDYFVFSGHKVYAPFGCGALVVKNEYARSGLVSNLEEAGEENLIGIAAMARSINLLQKIGLEVIEDDERFLTEKLLKGLSGINGLKISGITDPYSSRMTDKGGIVAFCFKNGKHQSYARALSLRGAIGLRYGCFCAHMPVKQILGVTAPLALLQNVIFTLAPKLSELVPGLMRVSFGLYNEPIEIERFIAVLKEIIESRSSETKSREVRIHDILSEFCSMRSREIYGS